MWQQATNSEFSLDFKQYGWKQDQDCIEPIWYEGAASPLTVEDVLLVEEQEEPESYDDDMIDMGDDSFL